MLVIRCKMCNKHLTGNSVQLKTCGCPNQTSIRGETVSAIDHSQVEIVQGYSKSKKTENTHLTSSDLSWQEHRRKRGVRKLDFEVR
jgi:phage FluMu protein Com